MDSAHSSKPDLVWIMPKAERRVRDMRLQRLGSHPACGPLQSKHPLSHAEEGRTALRSSFGASQIACMCALAFVTPMHVRALPDTLRVRQTVARECHPLNLARSPAISVRCRMTVRMNNINPHDPADARHRAAERSSENPDGGMLQGSAKRQIVKIRRVGDKVRFEQVEQCPNASQAERTHTEAFASLDLKKRVKNFDLGRALTQRSGNMFVHLEEDFEQIRAAQPRQLVPLDARPPMYPQGLKTLLIGYVITLMVVRFIQLVLDILGFGRQVLITSISSIGERTSTAVSILFGLDDYDDEMFAENDSTVKGLLGNGGMGFSRNSALDAAPVYHEESAEWVNVALRKAWSNYNDLLEQTVSENLQISIDDALSVEKPPLLKSIHVKRFHLGQRPIWIRSIEDIPHPDPYVLTYNLNARYDGDASVLLVVELSFGTTIRLPVMISELDLDAKFWLRARLIPKDPYVADACIAFVDRPRLNISIKPFKYLDIMYIPGLNTFLRKLLTREIPAQFTLPMKVDIFQSGSPFLSLARRVAQALADGHTYSALGKVGTLSVSLYEAKGIVGTTSLGLSNPFCALRVGNSRVRSKHDRSLNDSDDRQGNPIWNQRFDLDVSDPLADVFHIEVFDRYGLKNRSLGWYQIKISNLKEGQLVDSWVRLKGTVGADASLHIALSFRLYVVGDVLEEDDYFMETAQAEKQAKAAAVAAAAADEKAVSETQTDSDIDVKAETLVGSIGTGARTTEQRDMTIESALPNQVTAVASHGKVKEHVSAGTPANSSLPSPSRSEVDD
ncbi:Synaptotagmin-5 [Porphyridium purpureum]|uniref:Synaptotagmin-5 n=1 Tax=Porphyridium purpureum TaxID=35688 RepID=A0A5J4YQ43_PORPP|nr:Synaptotagmin-5 [Porphyridium purpureum]|eukprot:POR2543..scf222_8